MKNKYICIEGNLGAGKTTFVKALSQKLDAQLILESFLNNPFLDGLYAGVSSSKLPAELFFLTERIDQLTSGVFNDAKTVVADYHIDKTELFAKANLGEKENALFSRLFYHAKKMTPIPHVVIFIEQSPKEAYEHVQQRGRDLEVNISLAYLSKIDRQYHHYLSNLPSSIIQYKIAAKDLRSDPEKTLSLTQDFLKLNHIV